MTEGPRPASRAGSASERPHVLVVSSDQGLREFLSEGLMLAGFWTSAVGSAVQVLEVFRLRTFDLVLVDAGLGGIAAVELVRRLRGRSDRVAGNQPRTDVPIVFVAADASEIEPDAASAAGGDDVLFAPLEIETLAPRLLRLVQEWRASHSDRPYADQLAQLRPGER